MRGVTDAQTSTLAAVTPDTLIPPGHPIPRIKKGVEAVLDDLDTEFNAVYTTTGRTACRRSSCQGERAHGAALDPQRAPVPRAAAARPASWPAPRTTHPDRRRRTLLTHERGGQSGRESDPTPQLTRRASPAAQPVPETMSRARAVPARASVGRWYPPRSAASTSRDQGDPPTSAGRQPRRTRGFARPSQRLGAGHAPVSRPSACRTARPHRRGAAGHAPWKRERPHH